MVGAGRDHVLRCTALLRSSPDALWVRIRSLLKHRGLAPDTAVLAETFPDDSRFQFGLVVTPQCRVYRFGFDYLHRALEEGTFAEWVDLTESYAATPYRQAVETAIEIVGEGFPPGTEQG